MKNIVIFASGNGTNAERIIQYFKENEAVNISLILTNKPEAGVLKRAEKLEVPTLIFNRDTFYKTNLIVNTLKEENTDLVVLAGFLWLIPDNLLKAYTGQIVNIHPALLPKYGGKGMYGQRVHEMIIDAKEKESGITIHYVNEKYDEGQVIFQAKVAVTESDTPNSLAEKIHKLEHQHFPEVIEELLRTM